MQGLDFTTHSAGTSLASSLIVVSLIQALIDSGRLTRNEVATALKRANDMLQGLTGTPNGLAAHQLIGTISRHFAQDS